MALVKSMTGFGSAKADELFIIEIVSYNGKRLEILFDAPQALFPFEMAMRQKIAERLERGTIKVRIRFSDRPKKNLVILKEKMEALARSLGYNEALSFSELLSMMSREEEFDSSWEKPLLNGLDKAVDELIEFRKCEGKSLQKELLSYQESLQTDLENLGELKEKIREQIREEIQKKLHDLKLELSDESRLVQEAFFLSEKRDVSEELSRLSSHFVQLKKLLESKEPQGKILTFLLQEVMRELNTTCAKKPSEEMVRIALGMKGVAEKMREQVQNVE
ncbi:MAG: DUF1732 domain-containing protein [Candidatus Algichlamydia australiensis]|nr:DUF1732 domain-containing protein [Chlamydiales bacterium]